MPPFLAWRWRWSWLRPWLRRLSNNSASSLSSKHFSLGISTDGRTCTKLVPQIIYSHRYRIWNKLETGKIVALYGMARSWGSQRRWYSQFHTSGRKIHSHARVFRWDWKSYRSLLCWNRSHRDYHSFEPPHLECLRIKSTRSQRPRHLNLLNCASSTRVKISSRPNASLIWFH